jgi:hypothetical protein
MKASSNFLPTLHPMNLRLLILKGQKKKKKTKKTERMIFLPMTVCFAFEKKYLNVF